MSAYLKDLQGVVDPLDRILNSLGILFILKSLFPCSLGTKRMEPSSLTDKGATRSKLSLSAEQSILENVPDKFADPIASSVRFSLFTRLANDFDMMGKVLHQVFHSVLVINNGL